MNACLLALCISFSIGYVCWNVMCESLSFVVYGSKISQSGVSIFQYASEGIESRRWFGY